MDVALFYLALALFYLTVVTADSLADKHRCVPRPRNHGCHSVSYLPAQKVIFCTTAKSSSTEWRRFLLRAHDDAAQCGKKPCWCGTSGCIHEGTGGPPIVHDAHHFERLRRQGYVSAMYMRDPFERAGSIFTGTAHITHSTEDSVKDTLLKEGHNPTFRSLDHFLNSWLPAHLQSNGTNEHFMSQMAQCNFGLSPAHPVAPRWDYVVTSGDNQTDTFDRVTAFIRRVFGDATYNRAAAHGWCTCDTNGREKCVGDKPFFSPHHASKGDETASLLTPQQRARVAELYADDVAFFEYSRRTRARDGAAPDDDMAACASRIGS